MKKFIKSKRFFALLRMTGEVLKDNAIPIMSFLIVVLALTPYCREWRGYYAIGGEYILAGVVAYAVHRAQCTVRSEK